MRTIAIVPARGGSKGISRKNLRLLGRQPLMVYTAEAARAATRLSRVLLTTDDEEIAAVGRWCGLDVPFIRPAELAADDTPMVPVVQHAVSWLEAQGERVDAVCLLQLTSPFRRPGDIDACIEMLEESGADSVVSMLPVPHEHNPHWTFLSDGEGNLSISTGDERLITRRQDLPPAYHRDGAVYVVRRDVLMHDNSLYGSKMRGFVTDPTRHVNLDTMSDWERAEALLQSMARAS